MTEPTGHFLQHFFADMRSKAERPLLCEKQGAVFNIVSYRETASRLADFGRSLGAAQVKPGDRVTLHAAASPWLLIAEWAVLANRAVAVIVPRGFSPEDLVETLIESRSRLAIVDRLATAYQLADAAERLPGLQHILCIEGGARAEIPITSWNDFIDAGRMEADRSTTLLNTISPKDTALLFYYKDGGTLHASLLSHAQILDYAARMESLLKTAAIRHAELVLTATSWEHAVGHVASCYAPALKLATVQLTHGVPDIALFENSPQVIVGDSQFFDGLRQNIMTIMRQSGQLESVMLEKALVLSRQSYAGKKSGLLAALSSSVLQATVVKKVKNMLGGKMRLLIGTDSESHYDIQVFFHTFGVELVELPEEAFR